MHDSWLSASSNHTCVSSERNRTPAAVLGGLLFVTFACASEPDRRRGGDGDDDAGEAGAETSGGSAGRGGAGGSAGRSGAGAAGGSTSTGGTDASGATGGASGGAATSGAGGSLPGSGGSAGSGGTGAGGTNLGGAGGSGNAGAPRFLSFTVNTTTLDVGDTLVFSAILTDPDGIDDLIGGTLLDGLTDGTYGSFATASAEGAYSLSIPFAQINMASPITSNYAGESLSREFRATFFDQVGNETSETISVALTCGADQCCNGAHVVFWNDPNNCGACGHRCAGGDTCSEFACGWQGITFDTGRSCDAVCGDRGGVCAGAGTAVYGGSATEVSVDCASVPPAESGDPLQPLVQLLCPCRAS